ncbi:MAG: flagellar basal body P-ring formation protein FlgA [Comamonadaceae bacterium]|nr:MAG: flagellar basal body P-ring formation protein FlgA [Comamonadaceae bacterium]
MRLLLLLWFASAACVAGAAQVRIELRPAASAVRAAVVLGDIARIESADLPTVRRLADLPLGRAPAAGVALLVGRDDLAAWLRRRAGMAADQLEWHGAAETRVVSSTQTVGAEQITAAAEAALRAWLSTRAARSDVQLATTVRDVEALQGELRLQARDPGAVQLRSRMTVWVDVWASSRFVRAIPVTFAVAAWGERPLLVGALRAGAPLADGTVAFAEVDLTAVAGAPLASVDGLRARRALPAGEMLRKGNVEPVPAVARGTWAALRSGEGAVRTEARVQVLQDGRIGEQVRVRASGAAASLLARVTAAGQLEVGR